MLIRRIFVLLNPDCADADYPGKRLVGTGRGIAKIRM